MFLNLPSLLVFGGLCFYVMEDLPFNRFVFVFIDIDAVSNLPCLMADIPSSMKDVHSLYIGGTRVHDVSASRDQGSRAGFGLEYVNQA